MIIGTGLIPQGKSQSLQRTRHHKEALRYEHEAVAPSGQAALRQVSLQAGAGADLGEPLPSMQGERLPDV